MNPRLFFVVVFLVVFSVLMYILVGNRRVTLEQYLSDNKHQYDKIRFTGITNVRYDDFHRTKAFIYTVTRNGYVVRYAVFHTKKVVEL